MVSCLQWEDAADGEEDWETAEAPVSMSGVTGSFDVEASTEAGTRLASVLLQSASLACRDHAMCCSQSQQSSPKQADQAPTSWPLVLCCTHLCPKDGTEHVEAAICLIRADGTADWGALRYILLLCLAQTKCRGLYCTDEF